MNKFYDIILTMGMLQVFCITLTIIFPEFRKFIIDNSGSEGLEDVFTRVNEFRIYGLARGYTFTMPLFQGLCIVIATALGFFKTSKYFLLIPIYIFSIAINARIALISILIVPFVILFIGIKKNPGKKIFGLIILLVSIYFVPQFISYKADNSSLYSTWSWLNSGIEEIIDFKSGEIAGNLYALTKTMWFYPEGIELLFGTGVDVFGGIAKSSDIGYVINLYYGGVILSILIYIPYIVLLMTYCKGNLIERTVNISVLVYLFLANFKGNVFRPNEIINGVLVLIIFSITLRILHKPARYVSHQWK
ncbi:MAG: hypothetical protein ACWGKN_12260 [Desulfoprunum sp.]